MAGNRTSRNPETLFRVVFGLLFFFRGTMKLFGIPFGTAIPVGTWPLWAGVIEVVLGALSTIGLFTRIAAFIVSGEMAVAYFWMHFPKGFWPYPDATSGNGGEVTISRSCCWPPWAAACTPSMPGGGRCGRCHPYQDPHPDAARGVSIAIEHARRRFGWQRPVECSR